MAVLKKGTKLTCPMCNEVMCIANRDIYSGEKLSAKDFDAAGDNPIAGKPLSCPMCNSLYLNNYKIHTEHGWV